MTFEFEENAFGADQPDPTPCLLLPPLDLSKCWPSRTMTSEEKFFGSSRKLISPVNLRRSGALLIPICKESRFWFLRCIKQIILNWNRNISNSKFLVQQTCRRTLNSRFHVLRNQHSFITNASVAGHMKSERRYGGPHGRRIGSEGRSLPSFPHRSL